MIGATRSPYSILLACAKRKQIEGDTGSVTADYNVIGVRPSSGPASTGCSDASDSIGARSRSDIAAPEDGRTPPRRSPAVADPAPQFFFFRFCRFVQDFGIHRN